MSWYPENPNLNQTNQTDTAGITVDKAFLVHLQLSAAQAAVSDTDGVHVAITDNGSQQVITTGITNPPYPRNVTALAGGVASNIKAIQVGITGTNFADEVISETLPAFTENTAGGVVGSKAFKTITSITIPAHDDTGATTAIGFGEVIGLPDKLPHNTLLKAYLNNTLENTAPTVSTSTSALESNTVTLNSTLTGDVVDIYYIS